MWIHLRTFPYLYLAYMAFVWKTSRVDVGNFYELHDMIDQNDGAVALLWHEEVFTVAYGYSHVGLRPHTLASLSNDGDVVTRLLELCGFHVFRGGSSRRTSRTRRLVIREMIDHMKGRDDVLYGLTVDGSNGPPYRLKAGGIVIARECGKPIALVRTWYRRRLRLNTWDRTGIPLPFNHIRYAMRGPYRVPADANTRTGLERFRQRLENDLIDLAAESYDALGQPRPANLIRDDPAAVDSSRGASQRCGGRAPLQPANPPV